jgi:hypothetical protein
MSLLAVPSQPHNSIPEADTRLPCSQLVADDRAAFHDELHVLQVAQIRQRIDGRERDHRREQDEGTSAHGA